MISSIKGIVKAAGTRNELLADVSAVVRALKEQGFSDEQIKEAVQNGLMDDKELVNKLKEKMDEFFSSLLNTISEGKEDK